jgi:hypothetical protein
MALTPAQQWLRALQRTHGAAPATGGSVGSPAPSPQQPAPDATYISQVGANNRPYDNALAQLPANLQAAGAQYGYSYSQDPNDPLNVTVGGVDTSNPYSRAALLQRSYEQRQRGNTNSLAARGQLYSGALQNAQNSAFTDYNQASTENRQGFENLIRGYISGLGGLGAERDVNNAGAFGSLVERLANDPNQPPAQYAGVPYAPGTPEDPFATPLAAPTAASVMASQSLRGTALDRPVIGKYTPLKKKPRKR